MMIIAKNDKGAVPKGTAFFVLRGWIETDCTAGFKFGKTFANSLFPAINISAKREKEEKTGSAPQ